SLWLQSASGTSLDRRQYALAPNGLLATAEAAPIVARLISGSEPGWPSLVFVPAFVEPGSTVLLLGAGFEGKAQFDRVLIDGLNAPVYSASADSLLVKVPPNLSIGPMKQVVVATRNGDTPTMETDAVNAALELPQAEGSKGELAGRIIVAGTDLP